MFEDDNKSIRKVIGKIGMAKETFNSEKSLGFVDLGFEFFEHDNDINIQDINKDTFFCDSRKVFIYKNFNLLTQKFNHDELVIVEASKSDFDVNPGINKQEFVADSKNVTRLPSTLLFQIIDIEIDLSENNFTIQLENKPSTEFIMLVRNDNDGKDIIYGPLAWSETDQDKTFKVSAPSRSPIINRSFRDQYSCQIDYAHIMHCIIETEILENTYKFIVNKKEFEKTLSKHAELFDVMDNDKILKEFAPVLFNYKPFQKLTAKSIDNLKNNERMARTANSKLNKNRLNRALKIVESVQVWGEERDNILHELIKHPTVELKINEYIEVNENQYFEQYRKNELQGIIEEVKKEESKLSLRIDSLKQMITERARDKQVLDDDILREKDKLDKMAETRMAEIEEKAVAKAKEEEKELSERINEKQIKLDHLNNRYSNLSEIDDLNTQKGAIKIVIDDLKSEEQDLISAIEELEKKFKDKGKILSSYIENLSIFKTETTSTLSEVNSHHFSNENIKFDDIGNTIVEARSEFVNRIGSALFKYNRNYSREAIVNFIVTLSQNQFTIFAGLPGGGKTSMAKLLGKAMNLGNRQHTIPVSRNWTSTKDILGYYNGLSGQFQDAPTGLWPLLNAVQDDDAEFVSPVLLLLDEMNLSQPEHYISPFLDLSDQESERCIMTGHPKISELYIPEHLKFIGTVNFDSTIQPLSPRMIDRSAVISFDYLSNESISDFEEYDYKTCSISAKQFIELFKPNDAKIDERIMSELNNIVVILEDMDPQLGQRHIVSYRKRKQILNYIEVADSMLLESDENIALDQAISQYILPMINGFGSHYGQRLSLLLEQLKTLNCNQSEKILYSIIISGEQNLNSYRFNI